MFPLQIITDKNRIEPSSEKVFRVLPPKQEQSLNERTYRLMLGRFEYEIICLEIEDDEARYLVVPEFMIPGRLYPIYVYIYGMVLYSSNPKMGQREAAEKTRKRFDLKTFSHTTLGRAMKKLEALINTSEEKRNPDNEAEEPPLPAAGRFLSAELTSERRDTVLSYLIGASGGDGQLTQEPSRPQPALRYNHPPYLGAFIDACHRVVDYTFKKYHRFLL